MDLDEFLSENGVAGRGPALSPRHNPFRQAPGVMADTSQPQLQEAAIQEEADLAAANGTCTRRIRTSPGRKYPVE